ncbi:IMP cyclohydrolase [Candidatus Woesearchaeota archaeon]|nr:IMP cyclohydrolase [Candidatus Woesearchaeota archaeon]
MKNVRNVRINRAIISCYEKRGLKEFASELVKLNPDIKIFSSSGTYKELEPVARNNLVEISEYVGFREMPAGLVKTLHPKIHSGILAELEDPEQKSYLEDNKIEAFDLVVVNLYQFERAVSEGKCFEDVRKNIDIGGVSLLEAASKNFLRVAVVADPEDYAQLINALKKNNCSSDLKTRLGLAKKAVAHLQHYLSEINNYFGKLKAEEL